jgi:hypothetical protein
LPLKEGPVGISSSDVSKVAVGEAVVPEEVKEEELEVPSEGQAEVKLEEKEPTTSPGEVEEKVSEKAEEDSADFDIQEFLEELDNLPSEQSPESDK